MNLELTSNQHTRYLRELIRSGKQLILKSHDAVKRYSFLYYPKTPFYTKKLRKLDARLERASRNLLLQLNVQQMNKLLALKNNDKSCDGHAGLADKIKKIFMGPNLLGRVVEHIKVDPKEGVEGRIEEMIKKWGEGRFEKIFHRTFETTTLDDEKLQSWFGCDLSIILEEHYPHCPLTITPGVLFVSTTRLAFLQLQPYSTLQ
ncbi:unnamed protein product [Citrullus colocynthis]|uniref:Uncharacterized protein n=1 Tax=Citrullus colocynthis TaxID=252529 RepID=A0ABP0YIN4_9ROSI